jgi:flagellar biosynthesis/type III secretory pathway protein FliH
MPRETKAQTYERGRADGHAQGFAAGIARGKQLAEQGQEERRAKIALINAVGQSLNTQALLIQGLASVFDNSGGLK